MTKKAKPRNTAKRGRPHGSKNIERDEVDVIGSRCKRCGSSERAPYTSDPVRQRFSGIDPVTKRPYTQIVWRRTKCLNCGQHRIDKCYENEPQK